VLGVIYEARPNVTIDVATLCLKTGNAVILRGGKETFRSNIELVKIIQTALEKVQFPKSAVQYIDNPDRKFVTELLQLDKFVDMIIPRGGAGLHKLCREQSFIPVITGGIGICHVFVDESADLLNAIDIVENSKVQRPSVCNALDTLLIHKNIAEDFLPKIAKQLAKSEVELRAEEKAFEILQKNNENVVAAEPDDFDKEWLALILGVKIVDGIDDAISHIHEHSSEHTDCILTQNDFNAEKFVKEVNSAAVYVNASTRFTDGGEFGLGAEVAISTQKLHARGPMGLEELTTYKWIGLGDGQIRE
jgi:glutamate-5-semialdehyde dehydrogenase